jgi:type I restriction enzyme S subunit
MDLIKLKDTVDILTGCAFKGDKYSDKGTRVVRGENVTEGKLRWDTTKCWNIPFDREEFYKLKADDIVIGMDGSKVGKNKARIFVEDLPLLLAQRVACLRAKENIDQVYLYYCINNPIFEDYVFRIQTGSSVPHISKTQIEEFQIPFPNLSIQKKIAKFLSDIDAKIEINNTINQELEAMAKKLYVYWFVQFDFPDAKGKPYKSSGGLMVFNEELKREIPVGWEDGTLGDLCTRIGDGLHGTPKYINNSEYSFINGNNLKNGFIYTDKETKKVSTQEYEKHLIKLNDNSILLSINGTLGNLAIYNDEKVMLGKSSAYINCKENYRTYCYEYLNQNHMPKVFWNIATGSTIKNLGLGSIKNLKILKPDTVLILKFSKLSNPILEKRKNVFKQNQKLSELRDWLLPMLMNGQITAGGSEIAMENLGLVAEGKLKYGEE